MEKRNYGLIIETPQVQDYVVGATTPVAREENFPDGHGIGYYLPAGEVQFNGVTDYMDCVTESATNCVETICNFKFGDPTNNSERFTAKMSGTTPEGNSQRNVGESIRNDGMVDENTWPRKIAYDWDNYYTYIPATIKSKAKKLLNKYEIKYEWVGTDANSLKEALKHGPIQVIGYAWQQMPNGLYNDYGHQPNHAFMLFDYVEGEKWLIYDSYNQTHTLKPEGTYTKDEMIKELAWDFKFGSALQYTVNVAANNGNLILKIKNMFTKIKRATDGGLFFVKNGSKQKLEDWLGLAGALIDEIGCQTLKPEDLNKFKDTKFFGK